MAKFNEDFQFGSVKTKEATEVEDTREGKDIWVGALPIAYRKRRIPLSQYSDISIRYSRSSGSKTEYEKILNGECKALLYIFEFLDAFIVCCLADIADCLRAGKFKEKANPDGETTACYIKLTDINHLHIAKPNQDITHVL